MNDHEMNTSPGKILIKTIVRGMRSPKFFFRQRAALNFPLKFPLKVRYIIDNEREKYFEKHYEAYYPDPNALRQNIL